jgi:1,4-alpha-glucan branching enzyme
VVVNFANRAYDNYTLGFPRAGLWRVRFNGDWQGYSPRFSNHGSYDTIAGGPPADGLPLNGTVGLGPYSAVILFQDGRAPRTPRSSDLLSRTSTVTFVTRI